MSFRTTLSIGFPVDRAISDKLDKAKIDSGLLNSSFTKGGFVLSCFNSYDFNLSGRMNLSFGLKNSSERSFPLASFTSNYPNSIPSLNQSSNYSNSFTTFFKLETASNTNWVYDYVILELFSYEEFKNSQN